MRCAVGSLAIVALFAFAGSLLAQSPEEDQRRAFFKALREGAAARGEGIEIVPVPRFGAEGEAAPAGSGDGVGVVQVEEEFASPETIEYELTIIHLTSAEDFSEEERAVSGETVDRLLQNWRAGGKLAQTSTFRLTSLDLQKASVQIGQQIPVVTARSAPNDRGVRSQAVNYQQFGTLAVVTGRIDGAKIVIECQVEESRLEPSPIPVAPTAPSPDEVDVPRTQNDDLQIPSMQKLDAQTTVTITDGGKVILSSSFQQTAEGSNATIVTLKASILP